MSAPKKIYLDKEDFNFDYGIVGYKESKDNENLEPYYHESVLSDLLQYYSKHTGGELTKGAAEVFVKNFLEDE